MISQICAIDKQITVMFPQLRTITALHVHENTSSVHHKNQVEQSQLLSSTNCKEKKATATATTMTTTTKNKSVSPTYGFLRKPASLSFCATLRTDFSNRCQRRFSPLISLPLFFLAHHKLTIVPYKSEFFNQGRLVSQSPAHDDDTKK
jgi:hypothetical protein